MIIYGQNGLSYTDQTISSLSSGQAAGTTVILAANLARAGLKITPPADCTLSITSGAARGQTLIGGLTNTITGPDCPTNALYISGLTAGVALVILEG